VIVVTLLDVSVEVVSLRVADVDVESLVGVVVDPEPVVGGRILVVRVVVEVMVVDSWLSEAVSGSVRVGTSVSPVLVFVVSDVTSVVVAVAESGCVPVAVPVSVGLSVSVVD
jgi:hypothetical protein